MHSRSKMAPGSHIMRINHGSWCHAAFRDRDVILSKCKFKNAECKCNFTLFAMYLSLWNYWVMTPITTAAWIDGIPPKVWKNGGPVLNIKFHEFFVCCWEQRKLPQDLRDAAIITLYKNKRGIVWLLQLQRDIPSRHRRQNLSKSIAEQACIYYCRRTSPRRTSPREPIWV